MSLLNSLLTAIMRADGDALVLHVGERPYVVTGAGNLELSHTVLTLDFVSPMLSQLLPQELLDSLAEVGAVEHQLQTPSPMRDAFTVVVARGGGDIWIEVRRKRAVVSRAPEPVLRASEAPATESVPELSAPSRETAASDEAPERESAPAPVLQAESAPAPDATPASVAIESASERVAELAQTPSAPIEPDAGEPITVIEPALPEAAASEVRGVEPPDSDGYQFRVPEPEVEELEPYSPPSTDPDVIELNARDFEMQDPVSEPTPPTPEFPDAFAEHEEPQAEETAAEPVYAEEAAAELSAPQAAEEQVMAPEPPAERLVPVEEAAEPVEPAPAIDSPNVVPLTRVIRVEVPPRSAAGKDNSVERLLAVAATRSAVQLYLTSQSRPFLRVEGEIRAMDDEATLSAAEIDAIVNALMPESARESHGRGEPAEWSSEVEGVGRVRCATFRDHRGPGVVFHLTTTRPISAEQLGLTRDIQALATESEGLVVVATPRGAGKSTLIGALVDLINRKHSVSVITIERQIRMVHENRLALVSQREVRGTGADAMSVVRAALRENPDVLVLEDLKSPEIVQLALDAAGTGRLVILAVTATSTVGSLTRIVESFPPASRQPAQTALAERLCGAVSQVVLRKTGGGRIAARELLLPGLGVTNLISEGQFAQLAATLGNGRKPGMLSLNQVLLSLVKSGVVDAAEAYRKADNRAALLALLERDGLDTSLLGRLA